jgi:NADH-quinone oxidoreductase subunit J
LLQNLFGLVKGLLLWVVGHPLLVLFLGLGGFAIGWLLPGPQRRPWRYAAGAGLAALLIGGLGVFRATGQEGFQVFLFYLFAFFAVAAGACMIVQSNPAYAALYFALVILSTCGLFLLQSAPFLAAATIIVYAGAIIVTFLFVIMLSQQAGMADYDRLAREPVLAVAAGFLLLGALLFTLERAYQPSGTLDAIERQLVYAQDQPVEKMDDELYWWPGRAPGTPRPAPDPDEGRGGRAMPQPVERVIHDELAKVPAWRDREAVRQRMDAALTQIGNGRGTNQRDDVQKGFQELTEVVRQIKAAEVATQGMAPLAPAEGPQGLARSTLSDQPQQPGHYVIGLGRTLFGDYLYGVELAGTLLLVATIGAIAIANRRKGVTA